MSTNRGRGGTPVSTPKTQAKDSLRELKKRPSSSRSPLLLPRPDADFAVVPLGSALPDVVPSASGDDVRSAETNKDDHGAMPSLTLHLSGDRGRSNLSPRDVANLVMWSLPTPNSNGVPIVESPRWCFLKHRLFVRHVLVVYCNGVSYDHLMTPTKLGEAILGDVRRERFVDAQQRHRGRDPFPGVQVAPLWVPSTNDRLEVDFFMRQSSNRNGAGGHPGASRQRSSGVGQAFGGGGSSGGPPAPMGIRSFLQAVASSQPGVAAAGASAETGDPASTSAEPSAVQLQGLRWSPEELGVWAAALEQRDPVEVTSHTSAAPPTAGHQGQQPHPHPTTANSPKQRARGGTDAHPSDSHAGQAPPDASRAPVAATLIELVMSRDSLVEHGFPLEDAMALDDGYRCFPDEPLAGESSVSSSHAAGEGVTPIELRRRHPAVAIDCEMVQTVEGATLARCTVLAVPCGTVLLDMLVKPHLPVADYVTRFSGITEEMLIDCPNRLEDAQQAMQRIITTRTLVLGHSLENDFKACKMVANCRVVDTSALFPHPNGLPARNSLKFLAFNFLDHRVIQAGSHNSVEDAAVTVELIFLKLKYGLAFGAPSRSNILGLMSVAPPPPLTKDNAPPTLFLVDRALALHRVSQRHNNIQAISCSTDDDVVRKACKVWRTKSGNAPSSATSLSQQQQHPSFCWVQLRECNLDAHREPATGETSTAASSNEPLSVSVDRDLSDAVREREQEATEQWRTRMREREAAIDAHRATKKGKGKGPVMGLAGSGDADAGGGSRKRPRDGTDASGPEAGDDGGSDAGEDATGKRTDPAPSGTEDAASRSTRPTTVEAKIEQLNLHVAALLNAAPSRTLVVVMSALCRGTSSNKLSSAHGSVMAFFKNDQQYKRLPETVTELTAAAQVNASSCPQQ